MIPDGWVQIGWYAPPENHPDFADADWKDRILPLDFYGDESPEYADLLVPLLIPTSGQR